MADNTQRLQRRVPGWQSARDDDDEHDVSTTGRSDEPDQLDKLFQPDVSTPRPWPGPEKRPTYAEIWKGDTPGDRFDLWTKRLQEAKTAKLTSGLLGRTLLVGAAIATGFGPLILGVAVPVIWYRNIRKFGEQRSEIRDKKRQPYEEVEKLWLRSEKVHAAVREFPDAEYDTEIYPAAQRLTDQRAATYLLERLDKHHDRLETFASANNAEAIDVLHAVISGELSGPGGESLFPELCEAVASSGDKSTLEALRYARRRSRDPEGSIYAPLFDELEALETSVTSLQQDPAFSRAAPDLTPANLQLTESPSGSRVPRGKTRGDFDLAL